MKEALVGEELVRIVLEAYEVHLVFTDTVLQIGADFLLTFRGETAAKFDPSKRAGEFTHLWSLVGARVEKVVWDGEVRVLFGNGNEIRVPPRPGQIRGSLLGRRKEGAKLLFQDF